MHLPLDLKTVAVLTLSVDHAQQPVVGSRDPPQEHQVLQKIKLRN